MIIKQPGRYKFSLKVYINTKVRYRELEYTKIRLKPDTKKLIFNQVPILLMIIMLIIYYCSIVFCNDTTTASNGTDSADTNKVIEMSNNNSDNSNSGPTGDQVKESINLGETEEDNDSVGGNSEESSDNIGDLMEPAQILFDEDDEEFYIQNPLDHANSFADFDVDQEVKVKDSDFNDFEDHKEFNTSKFYDPSDHGSANKTTRQNRIREPKVSGSSVHRKKRRKRIGARNNRTTTSRIDRHEVAASLVGGGASRPPSGSASDCALVLSRGGCITFNMVEWAIRRARRELRFRQPAGLNSPELSESAINSIGELNELTTRLLAARFQLTWDEIAFDMEQIDVRRTSLWQNCPNIFRTQPSCTLLNRYRSHTGVCNNLLGPLLGSTNMPFVRLLPPDYSDGVGYPRRSSTSGSELPPARLLALNLHPDFENPSTEQSVLFMSWGQLINHDLALASGARDATGHSSACCRRNSNNNYYLGRNRVCMPIQIGSDDPLYAQHGIRCHEFKRSLAGLRPGCSLGPRTQLNIITSYVDASFVYGSSRSSNEGLRRNERGLLAMWNYFEGQGLKALLPPQVDNPDEECIGRSGRGRDGGYCFRSGDMRTNQQIQLAVLHTIHSRQHNRLARALGQLNPHWNDNRIYHEARHVHIAIVQHILISEYLPMLLGIKLCAKYNLTESEIGTYWDHYDPTINPGISQAFAAAAFRQGHTTVPSQVFRFNNLHEPTRVYLLRQLFRQPWPLYEPGAMDEFLLGMVNAPAQSFDPFISSDLSGHLLQTPDEQVGQDLVAINIQRGRDQGVAGYNAFREWCGLGRVSSFNELDAFMSNQSTQTMATLYESVDDIDLFTGGISEFPLEGAQVGPTFACIIGHQFASLRSGDRFWFESSLGPQAFSLAQLESIKQVTLARVICANSDNVITIQQMALQLPHPVLNPRRFCNDLPDIDITLWFDPNRQPASESGPNEDETEDDNDGYE